MTDAVLVSDLELWLIDKAIKDLGANRELEPIYHGAWDESVRRIAVYCRHEQEAILSDNDEELASGLIFDPLVDLIEIYNLRDGGFIKKFIVGKCYECNRMHWARYGKPEMG